MLDIGRMGSQGTLGEQGVRRPVRPARSKFAFRVMLLALENLDSATNTANIVARNLERGPFLQIEPVFAENSGNG